jgi:hypothetical protein
MTFRQTLAKERDLPPCCVKSEPVFLATGSALVLGPRRGTLDPNRGYLAFRSAPAKFQESRPAHECHCRFALLRRHSARDACLPGASDQRGDGARSGPRATQFRWPADDD